MFPSSLSDITLLQWIAYTNKLQPLEAELKQVYELSESKRKQILITKCFVDRAFESALFFGVPGDLYVDDVLKQYEAFNKLLDIEVSKFPLPKQSDLYFGQLIDAKMTLQAGNGANRWELIRYLLVIYDLNWKYDPVMLDENSEQFKKVGDYTMPYVLLFSKWWDDLNNTLNESYTLFQDSGEDEGTHMKAHMERWGWINFLKSIAKTKVFDIPGSGMNSIDCARAAKMDDVLTWSSEEKEYNLAVMRDMEK